ncbi:D-alanyl-D-alanine carboxypeptidase [Desulfopila sp. IMCC35006]|uniref:D-alanyl-D-alanine carboxypeptidase family protein n=1 Tax=Desulfopila sp. IMCC35006 TaxID=2569542 RepID=UPI0010ACF93C|nr:D-alanyl-D-alanine carboxypeptidase family protein [Desulfopila sp. IMCC35006]TKB28600.1 D-alanyl-D-alanine carboxypeptidase [Desulfopila sp. IMCC35006]
MKRIALFLFFGILCAQMALAAGAKVNSIAQDPYISALVVDADSGKVLFEDQAGKVVYPASVLKIMDLLVILEQVEQGRIKLDEMVQVTPEASKIGGSQIYLDPKEQFSIQDLLYALAVQSANDAAVALAIHVAGSTEGFVALMNKKAAELGMKDTHFYSVHGLPPGKGQKTDQTTARDLGILGRELAKRTDIFEYTGTKERPIRDGKFMLRNHNHLLGKINGCDGFKTGYFQAAGFSIVATAKRGGVRIIAIVMGSKDRKVRDAKAAELLAKGFALVPPKPELAAAVSKPEAAVSKPEPTPEKTVSAPAPEPDATPVAAKTPPAEAAAPSGGGWGMFFLGVLVGIVLCGVLAFYLSRPPKRRSKFVNYS